MRVTKELSERPLTEWNEKTLQSRMAKSSTLTRAPKLIGPRSTDSSQLKARNAIAGARQEKQKGARFSCALRVLKAGLPIR